MMELPELGKLSWQSIWQPVEEQCAERWIRSVNEEHTPTWEGNYLGCKSWGKTMCDFASEVDHRHFHLRHLWNKYILVETCVDWRLSIRRFVIAWDRGDGVILSCVLLVTSYNHLSGKEHTGYFFWRLCFMLWVQCSSDWKYLSMLSRTDFRHTQISPRTIALKSFTLLLYI